MVDGAVACEHRLRRELSKEKQMRKPAGEHLYPHREQRMDGGPDEGDAVGIPG